MIEEILTYVVPMAFGWLIGGFVVYVTVKIKHLQKQIDNFVFPTAEEVAKEVIKVKIPVSDLPPEFVDNMKSMLNKNKGKLPPIHPPQQSYVG